MRKIVSIIILIVFSTGCKKYPEDVKVPHFGTSERRLMHGDWNTMSMVNAITHVGIIYKDDAGLVFEKDNTLHGFCPNNCMGWRWHLTNKKKNLEITDDRGNKMEYLILQLDHDKLKFKNDTLEYTFTPIRIH